MSLFSTATLDISMEGVSIFIFGFIMGWILCYSVDNWVMKKSDIEEENEL